MKHPRFVWKKEEEKENNFNFNLNLFIHSDEMEDGFFYIH